MTVLHKQNWFAVCFACLFNFLLNVLVYYWRATSSALPRGKRPIPEITECVEGANGRVVGVPWRKLSVSTKKAAPFALFCPLLPSPLTWEKAQHSGRAFCCTSYPHCLAVLCDCSPLRHEKISCLTPAPTASIPLFRMKRHLIEINHKPGVFSTLALLCKIRSFQKLLKCPVLFLCLPIKLLSLVELKLQNCPRLFQDIAPIKLFIRHQILFLHRWLNLNKWIFYFFAHFV